MVRVVPVSYVACTKPLASTLTVTMLPTGAPSFEMLIGAKVSDNWVIVVLALTTPMSISMGPPGTVTMKVPAAGS